MTIRNYTSIYDTTPADPYRVYRYTDDKRGTVYMYRGKLAAVAGLAAEDERLRGDWTPAPADEQDGCAWAILEMVIDNPAHIGLSAVPTWAR